MMKRIFFSTIMLLFTAIVFSQDMKDTTYDQFVSQSGKIIQIQDFKLPEIIGCSQLYKTKIRVISVGGKNYYYFQVEITYKQGNIIISVEEANITEMIKALPILIENANENIKKSVEYLENKFVTDDGVQIGYCIDRNEIRWYLGQQKSDAIAFSNYGENVLVVLKNAIETIVSLKK